MVIGSNFDQKMKIQQRPKSAGEKVSLLDSTQICGYANSKKAFNQHSIIGKKSCGKDNESILTYLRENIDPILSPVIRYVLKEVARIDDIPFLFLSYLKKYQDGYSLDTIMQKQTLLQKRIKRRRRSVETIKISTGIASFVSKVLSSIIKNRPKKNVVQILVTTVESFHLQNNITKEVTDYSMIDAKQLMQKYNVDIKSKEKDLHGSEKKTLVFFLAGLGGSGKSTLVSVLKGQNNPNCKPSLGFRPVSLKYSEDITVKLYDVGGGEKIRGIWNNYFHDAHGIIYIVDSACSQSEFQDTISVAKSTVGHKYLQGKPLLLISNKTDKPDSRSIDLICEKLNLPILKGGMTHTLTTSLHPARGSYDGKPDPKIDNALEWLIQKVVSNINELNERIIDDSKEMKAIQTKKQEEKERRIFKTSICKAFALNGEQRTDVLEQQEGEEFLAHEIGLSGHLHLPMEGKEVCSLVGYQRFALMIIGSMICTTASKRKRSWSWNEVLLYVHSVRGELNMVS